MAWNTHTPKGKNTVFPGKFKSFVRDVASLKRTASGHSRAKSVASVATESERAWSIASDFDCPEEQPEHQAGISVQLSLSFEEPLEFSCNRCYNSSDDFEPSERLLRGLLRRIDHGSYELITRKDPNATATTKSEGRPKQKRFEMTFQISQKGTLWAARTYTSYQKDVMTANSVKEVVLSSHRLIGLFLRRHDPNFVWRDGPIRDEILEGPETTPYRVGGIQSMSCIPRSRFLETTQSFEAIPGFKLELSITSRSTRRKPPEWHKTLDIDSQQTTPLNLAVAEALFSNASHVLEAALRLERRATEERHRHSCGFISPSCPHYEEDATNISLRVTNNLGPQFDHLHRTIASKLVLFRDVNSKDTADFINNLESVLEVARDAADHTISVTNDFEFRVVELRGRGWNLDEPLVFTLGPSDSYSRRSVQAILDRVQAGVADVLRGNAATVRMSAAKRGHYILDKTLLAPRDPNAEAGRWSIPSKNKAKVVDKLRRRIHQDIDMICKDTCSLDNLDDHEPTTIKDLPSKVDVLGQSEFEAVKIPLPGTPSPAATTVLGQAAEIYASTPFSTEDQIPRTPISETSIPFSGLNGAMERVRPKSFTFTKTGARAFPLVPTASSYGFTETIAPESPRQKVDRPVSHDSGIDTKAQSKPSDLVSANKEVFATAASLDIIEPQTDDPKPTDVTVTKDQQSKAPTRGAVEPVERRTSSSTVNQHRHSDAEEISLAPSTPSLVFGGGHSASSSLHLFTPQIQALSSGPDMDVALRPSTPDSHNNEHSISEPADVDANEKFPQPVAVDLPYPRFSTLAKYKPSPSPLQNQDHASDDDSSDIEDASRRDSAFQESEAKDRNDVQATAVSATAPDGTASSVAEPSESVESATNDAQRDADGTLNQSSKVEESAENHVPEEQEPQLPPMFRDEKLEDGLSTRSKSHERSVTPEQLVAIPVEITSAEDARTHTDPFFHGIQTPSDGFAQTRQDFDFDFSSPWSAASPYSEVSQPVFYSNLDNAIDDEPEGSQSTTTTNKQLIQRSPASSLVRPLFSRTRHRSFGSAGLLGIRVGEPRLIEVGLRRAFMMLPIIRGTGGSPMTGMSFFNNMGHRGRAAFLMKRPATSGNELQLARRPASSHGQERSLYEPDLDQVLMKRSASQSMLQDMVLVEARHRHHKHDKKSHDNDDGREKDKGKGKGKGRSGGLMFLIAGAKLASQLLGSAK
ncbi:hypothetical protein SUNI508_03254 [Seiridium unicorne]|uniref:Pt repeat family protein n=1 Tax=Seiridium unicorne TaxID=138068 RepID=A0ABR2VF45_9PEZI